MTKQLQTLFYILTSFVAFGQANYSSNPTNEQLLNFLQTDGISIFNMVLVSGNRQNQIALLSNGVEDASLEIEEGLMFSTGDVAFEIENKNTTRNASISNTNYVDLDLLQIEPFAFYDPVIIEFFIELEPSINTLTFSYQFASEEYPDYVGSIYNDVFAIFFKEAEQENYQNIALISGSGSPTAVNFINGGVLGAASSLGVIVDLNQTENYLNNGHLNTGIINPAQQPGPFPIHIEYNGVTKKLSSKITNLNPTKTYQVKLAIADTADPNFDSGVIFSPITATNEEASLRLTKDGFFTQLSAENRAAINDVITYNFELTNTGDVPLFQLSFVDEMFPNETPFSEINVFSPGESYSFQLEYSINQDDINRGVTHNIAHVSARLVNQDELVFSSIDPTPLDENSRFKDENCMDCTSVLIPQEIQLALIKRGYLMQPNEASIVGSRINYEFDLFNLSNVDLFNVALNDPLPNLEIEEVMVDISANSSILNVALAGYSLIIEDIQRGEVVNQAEAFGFTWLGDEVEGLSDFEVALQNRPTVVPLNSCKLELYNAITPNNDGVNDFLFIEGVSCFPKNILRIFNRWGVEVFSTQNYNNQDAVFEGFSNARATIGNRQKLPDGVYYFVFQFENLEGKNETKKGSLYVTRGK